MNKQQLDERIEDIFASLPSDASVTFEAEINLEREIRRLISDVLDEVVPEKKPGIQEYGADRDMYCKECGGYDECDCEGFNEAITTITDKRKELGL